MKWLIGFIAGLLSGAVYSAGVPITTTETFTNAEGKQQRVRYTPYFYLEHVDEMSGVIAQVFVTLGAEMLPDDLKKDYKETAKNLFKNSEHVYAVANLYFLNPSQKLIDVHLDAFTWDNNSLVDETHYDLRPRVKATSQRSVGIAFYLKHDFDIQMELTINERKVQVNGKAKRLSTDEAKALFGS
ncbi:MAG TPA: hypothetical protein PK011_03795 [Marinagarivorans sp.]|nr:hypothetical protein [Marinagarivorans sp.]